MLEQLTYAQIGERLKISSEGARAIVKRNRLPRSHASDGKALVAIDLDELQHKPLPARSPRGQPVTDVVATLRARIEQLEAELAAEQQRSAGHRADYERERERADQLVTSQDKLVIQLKNLRLLLEAARQAAQPQTLREWWRWLRTTG
jgi:hypothetical protein